MDARQTLLLREILAESGLLERTQQFGQALTVSTRSAGGLLLFGPPRNEPWHLTAHLADEARLADLPELRPTLIRWQPPRNAPDHLAADLDRLTSARRGESLLVVTEDDPPDALLERVDDVRTRGARIFALTTGTRELGSLAHEVLDLDMDGGPLVSFEATQHLVSLAVGEYAGGGGVRRPAGLRATLGRLLDRLAGDEGVE